MHAFLVPALKLLFPCLDASSVKKILGEETLKTSPFLQPQTTHFHHFRRIRCNRLDTLDAKNPIRHHHPVSSSRGYYHVSQQSPKHLYDCPPNQGTELLGQSSFVSQQRHLEFSHPVRVPSCHNQGHPPLHCPLSTNSHSEISTRIDEHCSDQGLEASNLRDFHGCYTDIFGTMTSNNKETKESQSASKADDAAQPCSRSRSQSAPKSHPKPGHTTRAANPSKSSSNQSKSILEVLNSKLDKVKNNLVPVETMEETFPSIASRPPLPKVTKFTITEAAIAAATAELTAAISKHRANFQTMLTSSIAKRTPARENRLRANNVALMTLATICIQQAGGMHIMLERLYKLARQEERAARQSHEKALASTPVETNMLKTTMSTIMDAEGFSIVNR